MDITLAWQAVVMGIVEGLTEFLPVSSTGHLVITASWLDFWTKDKRDVFEVAIQLGAILAICFEYRVRLWNVVSQLHTPAAQRFTVNVAIAFLPAAVLGLLFMKAINAHLFNPVSVATAFIVGGLVILWAERRRHVVRIHTVDDMTWHDALKVGLAQCLALIPGTSRSGATIIGGLLFGLSRTAAAEFSFFLAIPTMFAATFYDLFKHRDLFAVADLPVIGIGFIVSFVVALGVVRALLRFISRHDFTVFAWYRIAFGAALLLGLGHNAWA